MIIPVQTDIEIDATISLSDLLSKSTTIHDGDIIVIAQKIISKNEDRLVKLDSVKPSILAQGIADQYHKDPKIIELILNETRRIVRMRRGIIITQTHHGLVCANAGIDESNIKEGYAALLPSNPNASADRFKKEIYNTHHKNIIVIISDTFGRPFRLGQINCAIGVSGLEPILDYKGVLDSFNRVLRVTEIAVADELASAAELVMNKTSRCPFAIIRGYEHDSKLLTIHDMIRSETASLFT